MSDGHAVTTIPVSRTCEVHDCDEPASESMIVVGDYGEPGIAVYCHDHADDKDDSPHHTAVGEVTQR